MVAGALVVIGALLLVGVLVLLESVGVSLLLQPVISPIAAAVADSPIAIRCMFFMAPVLPRRRRRKRPVSDVTDPSSKVGDAQTRSESTDLRAVAALGVSSAAR